MARTWDTHETDVRGDTVHMDIWYPRNRNVSKVQIGLMDVRAADSIQISYDFERDGWVVKQASRFSWNAEDSVCDPDWQEVAFIQAWARKETDEEEDARLNA